MYITSRYRFDDQRRLGELVELGIVAAREQMNRAGRVAEREALRIARHAERGRQARHWWHL